MKGLVTAVLILTATLAWADVPRKAGPHPEEDPFSWTGNDSLPKTPPSNTELALEIKSRKAIEDFTLRGWLVVFEVMNVAQGRKERKILYRAIAVRPGSQQWAYWVYEVETINDGTFKIGVEAPSPIAACPDGMEANEMVCGTK